MNLSQGDSFWLAIAILYCVYQTIRLLINKRWPSELPDDE